MGDAERLSLVVVDAGLRGCLDKQEAGVGTSAGEQWCCTRTIRNDTKLKLSYLAYLRLKHRKSRLLSGHRLQLTAAMRRPRLYSVWSTETK